MKLSVNELGHLYDVFGSAAASQTEVGNSVCQLRVALHGGYAVNDTSVDNYFIHHVHEILQQK